MANQRPRASDPISHHRKRRWQLLSNPPAGFINMRIMRAENDANPRKFSMAMRYNPPGKYGGSRSQTTINAPVTGNSNRLRPHRPSQTTSPRNRSGLCAHSHTHVHADRVHQVVLKVWSSEPVRSRNEISDGKRVWSWISSCSPRVLLHAEGRRNCKPHYQIPKP